MTSLSHLDYKLTVLSSRYYFSKYEFPKTKEKYRICKEVEGKESHSFYAIIEIKGQLYRVTLNISDNVRVIATVTMKTEFTEEMHEKKQTALSMLQKAQPDGITVSQHGNFLKFSQTIWDKHDSCDEDDLEPSIGFLLVTAGACMKCLLYEDLTLLTEEKISLAIIEAKVQFSKDNLDDDTIEVELSEDDSEDTLTLPIDIASISVTNKDNDIDEETGIMNEPPDFDSFVKRLRMKDSLLKERNEEKGKAKESSDNGWLDSTCFTPKEKEILTFFKIKMEQRKEKG